MPTACRAASKGASASPFRRANSDRVWAIVEADDGGVYRSDNGGDSWTRVNQQRDLRQRAWYYTHIYADPKNAEEVYVLNTGVYRSLDGGRTYSQHPDARTATITICGSTPTIPIA